jgi:hypothetical protein
MNVVGEWEGRMPNGLSVPRGESEPPQTVITGETAFSASNVSPRSWR